jgi:arginine/lysine/ornithine decarboxylase
MQLHENLQLWLDIFVDAIPKESVVNQLEEFQNLLDKETKRANVATETISCNNEYYGDQMMKLKAEIAKLKHDLRMKEVN